MASTTTLLAATAATTAAASWWPADLDLRLAIGWTLVHSLWQVALAWAAYRLTCWRTDNPSVRHAVGHLILATLFVSQAATLCCCIAVSLWPGWLDAVPLLTALNGRPGALTDGGTFVVGAMPVAGRWSAFVDSVGPAVGVSGAFWMAAVAVRGLWVAGFATWFNHRLRHAAELTGPLAGWCVEACRRFAIRRRVRFVVSASGVVPFTAGWVWPVVVMPAAALTGLTQAQLQALVLHELAHVARYDVLLLRIRSWFEAAYFFHPLLGQVTRSLGDEAEVIADRLAAREVGSARAYGQALLALEERREDAAAASPVGQWVARLTSGWAARLRADVTARADGAPIIDRIRRLHRAAVRRRPSTPAADADDAALPSPRAVRTSAVGSLVAAVVAVLLLGQSLVAATHQRQSADRARSASLGRSVLLEFSRDRPNAAFGPALAAALEALRDGRLDDRTLDALAGQLLDGVPSDLISRWTGATAGGGSTRAIPADLRRSIGTIAERDELVCRLRDRAESDDFARGKRRGYARAALCLAILDPSTSTGGGRGHLLNQPDFVESLGVTRPQGRRLDLAIRAENERTGIALRIAFSSRGVGRPRVVPTDDDLHRLVATLRVLPHDQTTAVRRLPAEVVGRLAPILRAAERPDELSHAARAVDIALAEGVRYRPTLIGTVTPSQILGPVPPRRRTQREFLPPAPQ